MRKQFRRCKLRKSVPAGTIPAGLRRVVLDPCRVARPSAKPGLGTHAVEVVALATAQRVRELLALIRRA
eukprot:7098343-Lingulodinium_polyedra.AAC.1